MVETPRDLTRSSSRASIAFSCHITPKRTTIWTSNLLSSSVFHSCLKGCQACSLCYPSCSITKSTPKVLVIGCGVVCPVVVLFFKPKGYSPVVLERSKSLRYEGWQSHLLQMGTPLLFTVPQLQAIGLYSLRVLSALEISSGWAVVVQAYETLKTSLGMDPCWRSSPFRHFWLRIWTTNGWDATAELIG
ncbi:hypothetical protein BGZ57DRAFT_902481 [Hyaloscypha finlandica]|nr:hypothetical protein BGZ57DRAFT_902481 [Hyaloscypha finlandica]